MHLDMQQVVPYTLAFARLYIPDNQTCLFQVAPGHPPASFFYASRWIDILVDGKSDDELALDRVSVFLVHPPETPCMHAAYRCY